MVRPSNTQPMVRLFAEARTRERMEQIAAAMEKEFTDAMKDLSKK